MGIDHNVQAASFRMLFSLSVLTLLSAILLTAVGVAGIVEEQPTRVQPVVDAYLLGKASSGSDHSTTGREATDGGG